MTTPQAILNSLEYKVRSLCNLLEGNGETDSIVERLEEIELENIGIMASQQRLENTLNLIVKLLSEK